MGKSSINDSFFYKTFNLSAVVIVENSTNDGVSYRKQESITKYCLRETSPKHSIPLDDGKELVFKQNILKKNSYEDLRK